MSNNKQSMKLYTEEQVNKVWKAGQKYWETSGASTTLEELLEQLTPIELPSDSLCINCDESKSTHNVCIDCMIKIGKENIELPSDEEIIKHIDYLISCRQNLIDNADNMPQHLLEGGCMAFESAIDNARELFYGGNK